MCLGGCGTSYTETSLPASAFSGVTVLPYWDDLYITGGTQQGLYYKTEGNSPNRTLIFEYYTIHFQRFTEYYQFQVIFFEALYNIVQIKYFEAFDGGISCTIGVQSKYQKGTSARTIIAHSVFFSSVNRWTGYPIRF